jgi:hypothetical protein
MATESNTARPEGTIGRPWHIGLLATIVLTVVAAVVCFFGIQNAPGTSPRLGRMQEIVTGSITRIELPADDTSIPDGPHRDEFRVACTVCHSARLVFTQPRLSDGQWTKVVQKMTGKYGAPLSSDDEKRIVQYLHQVHGK